MKHKIHFYFFVPIAFCLLFSCEDEKKGNANTVNDKLLQKIDSLSMKLDSISKALVKKDSVPDSMHTNPPVPNKTIPEEKKQTEVKQKTEPVVKTVKESDSTYYYYTGTKKKSVVITPWVNGRRKVLFYSPAGKLTYQNEDVRMSWSNITELNSFHPNGAASSVIIHNNPGASMYMYETTISFGTDNEPQYKTSHQIPEEHLEMPVGFYWDKASQTWKKQETGQQQEIPK